MIPEYVYDEAAQIAEDRLRLIKARETIPLIKAEIERHQANLDGAERLVAGLTESLPLRQRALELLCADQHWDFPPSTQSHAGTGITQVAKPIEKDGALVCDWASCGQSLIGSDEQGWVHAATQRAECKPGPGLQQGTDGDPTLRTVLPPHIAAEVRDA